MDEFVSLHTHSENSILDGFGSVKEYVARAVEMGQPALGLTDHGSLGGVYSLLKECEAAGIQPIPGCEFYMAPVNPKGARVQSPVFYGPDGKKVVGSDVSGNGAYTHMTVWAYNAAGLKNLYKLSSISGELEHTYAKPRIDFEMLADHSEGLIIATGCPSSEISTRFRLSALGESPTKIERAYASEQVEKAYAHARRLLEVFGRDRMFVEIMDHSMDIGLERDLIPLQLKLAEDLGLELLATNDAHYAHPHDAPHHEEMLAIQSKSRMSDDPFSKGGSRFAFQGDQYFMPTAAHMLEIFPEDKFPRAVSNTVRIAEMCEELSLTFDPELRPIPAAHEGETETETFKRLVREGFKTRYGNATPEVQEQARENIKKELEVFISSDFVGYMLTVYEYLAWAQDEYSTRDAEGTVLALSTGAGRGSVGGSTIAYVLGISETDPIRYELIFERFLSAGRGSVYGIELSTGEKIEAVASDVLTIEREGEEMRIYAHQITKGDSVLSASTSS